MSRKSRDLEAKRAQLALQGRACELERNVFKHRHADVLEKLNGERTSYTSLYASCCICGHINMRHKVYIQETRYPAVSHGYSPGHHILVATLA